MVIKTKKTTPFKLPTGKSIVAKPTAVKSSVRKLKLSPQKKSALPASRAKSRMIAKSRKIKPEVILIDEMIAGPNEALNLPAEISKEYLIVRRCGNCAHMPMSSESIVTLFSVLIVLLTVSILIQVGQLNVNHLLAFVSPYAQAASHVFIR